MLKTHEFNNLNNTINYGFIYEQHGNCSITLEDIISNVSTSLLIYDTKGAVFLELASKAKKIINNHNTVFAGLISHTMIKDLKSNGIVSGFYRSTSSNSNIAIAIADKINAYLIIDTKSIIKVSSKKLSFELFNYVNHLLWSRAEFEVLNNSVPKKITEIRLSVVVPTFESVRTKSELLNESYKYGTQDFDANHVLLTKPKVVDQKALLINSNIDSMIGNENQYYIRVFDEYYAPVNQDISFLFKGSSFINEKVQTLVNKRSWFDEKDRTIESEKVFEVVEMQPLDSYKQYEPDFEALYKQLVKDNYGKVRINVNVKPIMIDSTYQISPKYAKRTKIEAFVEESLNKLQKLADENSKKTINNIKTIKWVAEKIQKHNEFVATNEFGDDTLKNKKSSISKININIEDITIPQELLGKLYIKKNQQYFALKDETRLAEAKQWLKENNQDAIMVLDHE